VGGAAYRKLMRDQLKAKQHQQDYQYEEEEEPYEDLGYVQPKQRQNKPVRKVGKRKIRNQPSQEQISQYTARCATKAFQDNVGTLADSAAACQTEEDMKSLEKHLQKLILQEMMKQKKPVKPKERLQNLQKSVQQSKSMRQEQDDEYEYADSEYY
jgi:hypothetical protein